MNHQLQFKILPSARDAAFQQAFRAYFAEIGIHLKADTDVWDEIDASFHKEQAVCVTLTDGSKVVGFIMIQPHCLTDSMNFFTQKLGFIRELWVAPDYRRQGLGRRLVRYAEQFFQERGICKAILTYEPSAIRFYQNLGFQADPSYSARNGERVITKIIPEVEKL